MTRLLVFRWCLIGALIGSATCTEAQFQDSCLTSIAPGTSFGSSPDLFDLDADLLEWDGSTWVGGWPNANIDLGPPSQATGCRVIWMGSATIWTSGGEGFGVRLIDPLVAGQTYTFPFTYASHGLGSTGAFNFEILSNNATTLDGAAFITTAPAVGNSWTTNTISFTATASNAGDQWLILHNGIAGTSGLMSSFCSSCTVNPMPCPPISLGPDIQRCAGETQLLSTTENGTYLWSTGSTEQQITVSNTDTYWVRITTEECVLSDTVVVTFSPPPELEFPARVTLCEGDSVLLVAAVGTAEHLWSDGSTGDQLLVRIAGTYWVRVTTAGCTVRDTTEVTVQPLPPVDLPSDLILCAQDSVLLNVPIAGATYLWNTGSTSSSLWVRPPGMFSVEVSIGSCSATDSVTIAATACESRLTMPNIFSPNGDSRNDVFAPLLFEGMAGGTLTIYNRWGMPLQTIALPTGWNGKSQGSPCPEGTYYWTITAQPFRGEEIHDHGTVTLVR